MKTHTDKAVEGLMGYFGLSSKLPMTEADRIRIEDNRG